VEFRPWNWRFWPPCIVDWPEPAIRPATGRPERRDRMTLPSCGAERRTALRGRRALRAASRAEEPAPRSARSTCPAPVGSRPDRVGRLTAGRLRLLAPLRAWDGLDVACGRGVTTAALADGLPAGRAMGVDFAEAMVARAQERFARPGLTFAVDDAERLSQPTA